MHILAITAARVTSCNRQFYSSHFPFESQKQKCHETVSQGKTSSSNGRQTDRSTLKPSSLASVQVNYWKNAVRRSRGQSAVGQVFIWLLLRTI